MIEIIRSWRSLRRPCCGVPSCYLSACPYGPAVGCAEHPDSSDLCPSGPWRRHRPEGRTVGRANEKSGIDAIASASHNEGGALDENCEEIIRSYWNTSCYRSPRGPIPFLHSGARSVIFAIQPAPSHLHAFPSAPTANARIVPPGSREIIQTAVRVSGAPTVASVETVIGTTLASGIRMMLGFPVPTAKANPSDRT